MPLAELRRRALLGPDLLHAARTLQRRQRLLRRLVATAGRGRLRPESQHGTATAARISRLAFLFSSFVWPMIGATVIGPA
jgi:hypothetical protein